MSDEKTTTDPTTEVKPATLPTPEKTAHARIDPNPPTARWQEVVAQKNDALAVAEQARAEAEAAATALAEAREQAAQAAAEAARWRTRHERDLAYVDYRDRPNLGAAEVREFVEGQYESYAARETEAAKPFSEWLREIAPANPLLAPHLAAPVVHDPNAPVPKPKPANPNATAADPTPPAPTTAISTAEIRQRKREGTWSRADTAAELERMLGGKADGKTAALLKQLKGQQ